MNMNGNTPVVQQKRKKTKESETEWQHKSEGQSRRREPINSKTTRLTDVDINSFILIKGKASTERVFNQQLLILGVLLCSKCSII